MLYAGIELTGVLGDVVYLAIVIAFFALCLLFVRACAAIAGPEPADGREGGYPIDDSPIAGETPVPHLEDATR